MVKYIPNRHVKRMFPYEFFDELYSALQDYTPENAVFMLRGTEHEHKLDEDIKTQFETIRQEMIGHKVLEENNLYTLDQGEFLIVDTYIERDDVENFINNKPIARYILLAQLFDNQEKPIFSKDTRLKTLREIPEVLWDDPNLALVLMQFNPGDTDTIEAVSHLGIIKGPDYFIRKLLTEPVTPLLEYSEGVDPIND